MKKLVLFFGFALLGFVSNNAIAQVNWVQQTNPTSEFGETIQFVTATEGWINLGSNALLHTTDAGSNWQVVTPNPGEICAGLDAPGSRLSFVNSTTGWVIKTLGDFDNPLGAVLYKTTNSGSTWIRTVLSSTAGDAAIEVQFVDANNGWVLVFNFGTNAFTFLKTINGGTTWTPTNGIGIFYYVNANIGYSYTVGLGIDPPYTISKTTNGGETWTQQISDYTSGSITDMRFTDADNGWAVGENGKFFQTSNGGTTWIKSIYNPNYKNNKVFFLDKNVGWIAARPQGSYPVMLNTTDGGISWAEKILPFESKVFSMSFWDANTGWATLDFGTILYYKNNLGTTDLVNKKGISIYPNPNDGTFYLNIKNPKAKLQIEIYNVVGQKVFETTNYDQKVNNQITFGKQKVGIYFIKVNDGENTFNDKMIIK